MPQILNGGLWVAPAFAGQSTRRSKLKGNDMGYFSNGGEGEYFQERYCRHCRHWPKDDNKNCPVWAAHQVYCYDHGGKPRTDPVNAILDLLIPEGPDGRNEKCAMFIAEPTAPLFEKGT
jgi:hypothetical protein